jgi:Co/Zn/Cd efflux system component
MHRTTFHIPKMDCAAEEQMVRMRLEGMGGVLVGSMGLVADSLDNALVVCATGSAVPDLVAGALIFIVVANGARRILALSK